MKMYHTNMFVETKKEKEEERKTEEEKDLIYVVSNIEPLENFNHIDLCLIKVNKN